MATYNDLELEGYYLVKEKEGAELILVQPVMQTAKSVLLTHIDDIELSIWRKKDDTVYEIVEQLTEEQVYQYQQLFDGDDDEFDAWQDEEPGYSFEEDEEDEDEEAEEKKR